MKKRKVQVFLISKNLSRNLEISIGIQAGLKIPKGVELEILSVQTERDYRLMVAQGCESRGLPLAVLVDSYVVMDNGDRSYPDRLISNLKNELGYGGPIIAYSEQPVLNDHLIDVGATHRIGEPSPENELGKPVTAEDVITQATEIINRLAP